MNKSVLLLGSLLLLCAFAAAAFNAYGEFENTALKEWIFLCNDGNKIWGGIHKKREGLTPSGFFGLNTFGSLSTANGTIYEMNNLEGPVNITAPSSDTVMLTRHYGGMMSTSTYKFVTSSASDANCFKPYGTQTDPTFMSGTWDGTGSIVNVTAATKNTEWMCSSATEFTGTYTVVSTDQTYSGSTKGKFVEGRWIGTYHEKEGSGAQFYLIDGGNTMKSHYWTYGNTEYQGNAALIKQASRDAEAKLKCRPSSSASTLVATSTTFIIAALLFLFAF